jgi:hypothetical protein
MTGIMSAIRLLVIAGSDGGSTSHPQNVGKLTRAPAMLRFRPSSGTGTWLVDGYTGRDAEPVSWRPQGGV